MNVKYLTVDNFQETISGETNPVIVDFYADWCGPCKMIAPILEEIASENSELSVYKVNIDENPQLAERFNVRSIPLLVSFKNGEVHKNLLGAQPKERILELVE